MINIGGTPDKPFLSPIIPFQYQFFSIMVEYGRVVIAVKPASAAMGDSTKAKRNAFRAYLSALDSVDTNGDDFLRDPRELHSFLCDYMGAMQEKGKVREGDVGLMVRAFVNTLHGYMLMYCLNDDSKAWQDKVASMKLTIGLFIQGFSRQCTSCGA